MSTLDDMKRASALVDEADNAHEYQSRLVALALIARQYLRERTPGDTNGIRCKKGHEHGSIMSAAACDRN